MSADILLRVENLQTHLRSGEGMVRAVDGVSFTLGRGETFCLVGESGSGKSVCALSLIQLLPRDIAVHPGGRVLFRYRHNDGEVEQVDMLALDEERRREIRGARIAMIFQEPMTSLNPVMTIGEQITEALQLHWPEMSDAQARSRAVAALREVQIPEPERRVDEYPHRLSGGQRQRVMIAMAMACEPDLLIADEPTTALDVTVQAEILRLMKALQARTGMSILFITHDFGVVAQMADRVGVMRLGKLVECGALDDVLRRPRHDYTRQLLAALPENLRRERRAVQVVGTGVAPPPAEAPLLSLRGLKVHFPVRKGVLRRTVDHIRAVDGIDLDIAPGEILSLVGESGCGKTTLGRAILRLEQPTAGEVRFDGEDLAHLDERAMRARRRKLQVIFQDPMSSLNPRLTIATTLTEPMKVHGIGASTEERLERAAGVLESVELSADHLWRYPHEFSGGQRQRIGIARALALEPRFIVCDEVTSALDVSVQAGILELLLRLRDTRGLSLLFITHNIAVVEYLSDRVAVMKAGRIVEYGTVDAVCGDPQEDYTRTLMAAVPRVSL